MKIKEVKFVSPVVIPRNQIVSESPKFVDTNDGCVAQADQYGNVTIIGPKGTIMVPGHNVAYLIAFPTETVKTTKK